ncbi:MAG: tetratricopeptide repeat protein [Verrucomicrobiota bacterium]
MRRILSFFVLLLAVPAFAPAETLDQQIQFWQKRIGRDAEDFISPTKLGALYLQKARETGEFSANVEAEKNFRLALKRNPEHHGAIVQLASACLAQHKFSEALLFAEKAVKLKPEDAFSFAALGDACLELGRIDRAEVAYKKALELKPSLPTHSRMANLHWIKGEIPTALQDYERAIESGKSDSAWPENLAWSHLQKGEIHFRTGDFQKAEAEYLAASKIFPDHYSVLEHLAELRAAQTRFDESISLYQKVIAQTPRPEFCHALGDILQFTGKSAEAKTWHDRALAGYLQAANDGNAHYFHHLAGFYSDTRTNAIEALKWARKDFEIRQNVYACDTLAWALFRNDKTEEALAVIKKALDFGTKDSHVLFHAGSIYLKLGKKAEAAACVRRAMVANPRYNSFHAHR